MISSLRQAFQAQNFDRRRRRRGLQRRPAIVEHGANFAEYVAYDEVVAGSKRAVLHQHGGHGSAAAIEFRFEHYACCGALRSRLEFGEIGDQADHFHQQVQIRFLLRRNVDEDRLAAPFFGHEAAIGELLLHAVGHRVGLIDLVDGNDDGNFGGVRVIDGFDRLRHDAVIGSDDEHDDVGRLRSARTHACERLVTWRIEEHNLAPEGGRFLVGDANFVGTDVLRDATSFAFGNVGEPDRVEQRGLAVVDVTHDGDDRRTRRNFDGGFLSARSGGVDVFRSLLFEADHVGLGAEEARHFAGEFGVERLVDRGENAATEKARDQILRANVELFRQIFNADAFGDRDIARDRHRLIRHHHARWWRVALHRAFFYATRNVALAGPTRRGTGTAAGPNGSRRRQPGADAERTSTGRSLTRGMHGTTLTGTKRRTRRTSARYRGTRTLEDWLSRHGAAGRGTHGPNGRAGLCGWRYDARRRSFVYRTRACLWNDHARRRRLRWSRNYWRCGTRRGRWRLWRCRSGHRRCCSWGWRNDCCRRRRSRTRRGWRSRRRGGNRRSCRLFRSHYGRLRAAAQRPLAAARAFAAPRAEELAGLPEVQRPGARRWEVALLDAAAALLLPSAA